MTTDDPVFYTMAENGHEQQQQQQLHKDKPHYPASPLDNGTNIGSAYGRKASISGGQPFALERRPSQGGSDRRSSSSSSRRPSFGAPLHPMTSMTAVDSQPASASVSRSPSVRSSRASSRRGSGSVVLANGQQVVFHTRNQVGCLRTRAGDTNSLG